MKRRWTFKSASGDDHHRITVSPGEAATALGVSRDFFDEHILPELRVIRRGRLILIPVNELEGWADESSHYLFRDGRRP